MAIDAFQAEIARIALEVAAEHGFALAGGNALIAHGIVDRETRDVDLFRTRRADRGAVTGAVQAALEAAGCQVEVTRPPERNMGEFARLIVSRAGEAMQLEMARDWRKWPPVRLDVGPVLHIDDAVSSKVTAIVGRRAPRDFIDVAAALDHSYSRADLMRLAFTRDPGLRVEDFTLAVRQLDQLTLDDFTEYGVDAHGLEELRSRFADWPRREADDQEGHAVHATVAEEERRNRGASPRPSSATLAGQAYPPAGRTTPNEGHAPGSRPPPEGKPPHRSP